MQRDVDLSFADIHESPTDFLSHIREIYQHATPSSAYLQEQHDLRFLTYSTTSNTETELRLTDRGERIGERNYLAVSYTFEKFNALSGSVSAPDYRIIYSSESKTATRAPRTQAWIIQRAVQFAKIHDISYIWIDLDCIDRDDPDDVERHLHIVHEVFYRSRHAIALLSFCVQNATLLKSLHHVLDSEWIQHIQNREGLTRPWSVEATQHLARALRLLKAISSDNWFDRTWTLMERLSAPHMCLMVPCELAQPIDSNPADSKDISVNLSHLQRLRESILKYTSTVTTSLNEPLGNRQAADGESEILRILDNLCSVISEKFHVESETPPWCQALDGSKVTGIWFQIEQCSNNVLSDRLLILGYLCGFSRRLKTTELNHRRFSYSTCGLVLLLMNGWLRDSIRVNGPHYLWHSTFPQLLKMLSKGRLDHNLEPSTVPNSILAPGWDASGSLTEKILAIIETSRL